MNASEQRAFFEEQGYLVIENLLSDKARYITGATLSVDGGMSA